MSVTLLGLLRISKTWHRWKDLSSLTLLLTNLLTLKSLHGKMWPRLRGLPGLEDRTTHLGGSPHLSCKRDQIKMRNYMERRVLPPERVSTPTKVPPPRACHKLLKSCSKNSQKLHLVTKVAQKLLEKAKTFFGEMLKYANCTTNVKFLSISVQFCSVTSVAKIVEWPSSPKTLNWRLKSLECESSSTILNFL